MNEDVIPGVYAIICTKTNDKYVGSSRDVVRRLQSHFRHMAYGEHQRNFQPLYDKYGPSAFACYLIDEIEDEDRRFDAEQFYIDTNKFSINVNTNSRSWFRPKDLPPYRPTNIKPRRIELSEEFFENLKNLPPKPDKSKRIKEKPLPKSLPKLVAGIYRTPWGNFRDPKEAAAKCPVRNMTPKWIRLACVLSHDEIDAEAYHQSAYLKTTHDEDVIGSTYEALGFSFKRKAPVLQ